MSCPEKSTDVKHVAPIDPSEDSDQDDFFEDLVIEKLEAIETALARLTSTRATVPKIPRSRNSGTLRPIDMRLPQQLPTLSTKSSEAIPSTIQISPALESNPTASTSTQPSTDSTESSDQKLKSLSSLTQPTPTMSLPTSPEPCKLQWCQMSRLPKL